MKKKIRKLQLNRETLRNLTEGDLKEAVGGATRIRTCFDVSQEATCDCSSPTIPCC
jgi:hypothetical protein